MELDLRHKSKSFRDGAQYAWDATSLSIAQACLRKYQYKLIEGWQPNRLSDHLKFGQHYATALEHFYKLTFEGMDSETALVEIVWEALRDTWADGAPWQSLDNVKTRENLIRTIIWYIDHFADDPTPVRTLANGRPAVEVSFSLPVDNDIVFCGHLDRIVSYNDDAYVMDQKTTKTTIGQYYFDHYKPHMQMSMYSFAGRAILATPVKGVIIDAAQIAVGFTRFERGFTFRTEPELNEWYDNTMYWIERARAAARDNNFPMNESSCDAFGGCEFRKICSRPLSLRENFLRGDFTQGKIWDPLDRR